MDLNTKIIQNIYKQKIDNEKEYEDYYNFLKNDETKLAAFAMRKDIPIFLQEKIMKSSDFVKEIFASNNSVDIDLLKQLSKDENEAVKTTAEMTLMLIAR